MIDAARIQDRISIITVCFNAAAHIAENLASVDAQTWPGIEHVVVDGGSADGTQDLVRSASHPRRILISEPDRGMYDAMNKGIARSTGSWLLFLNADDLFHTPTTIADLVAAVRADGTRPAIHYGDCALFSRQRPGLIDHAPASLDLRRGMTINHQSMLYSADIFSILGPYRIDLRLAADLDHTLRCWRAGIRFIHHPMTVARFCMDGSSQRRARRYLQEAFPMIRHEFGMGAALALAWELVRIRRREVVEAIVGVDRVRRWRGLPPLQPPVP